MVATPLTPPTPVNYPPGDLYSVEPTMETDLHLRQMLLLISCLDWLWRDRDDYFASGNLTVYFSPKQLKSQDFRGPDFFVVLDTEKRSRKSWVVWEEDGKYPNVIVEILSDSTANVDRTTKKELYQNTFRTPEYFWFDPHTLEFCGFVLMGGMYEPIDSNEFGWLWSQQLGLFLGVEGGQLRFWTPEGAIVPLPQEAAEQAELKAEQAELKAEQAQEKAEQAELKAEQLAAKLRELGIEPETLL